MSTENEIKNFIQGNPTILLNTYSDIDMNKIYNISETRFSLIKEDLSNKNTNTLNSINFLFEVLNYLNTIEEKKHKNLLSLLLNEKMNTIYATIGKKQNDNEMEILNMSDFMYSHKDNGWVFK